MGSENVDTVFPLGFVGEVEFQDGAQLQGCRGNGDSCFFGEFPRGTGDRRLAGFDFPPMPVIFPVPKPVFL
jgi:hypothetical protein